MAQSREQARLAERRRQERRAARRAETMQERRMRSVIGAAVAVAVLIAAIVAISLNRPDKSPAPPAAGGPVNTSAPGTEPASPAPDATTAPPTTAAAAAGGVACGATAPKAGAQQSFKAEPPLTIDAKAHYLATLTTSCGVIKIDMDAAKTPHTVNSWAFLADKKYWDGSRCHRMTSGGLNVLQCGDPTATGSGGPGYTIPDENLAGSTYPKGSVAMANTGQPHTGGGQFFINYADSQLPPQYTVVGQVTADTMAVLDNVKAVGIAGGAQDGAPAKEIYLDTVSVAKK